MAGEQTETAHFICIGGMDFYFKRFPETREMALVDGVPTLVYNPSAKKVTLYSSHPVPVDEAQRAGLRAHKDFGTYYREVPPPLEELPPVVKKKKKKDKEKKTEPEEKKDEPTVQVFEEVTTKAAALETLASKGVGTGLSMRNSVDEIKAEAEAYFIEFPKL